MKKMFENKKWVALLVLALVVVAAIVIRACVGAGCGEKDPNPTEGTSNVGDPTETTGGNGNEVPDPSDNTEPSVPIADEPTVAPDDDPGLSDPTEPEVTPSEPEVPEIQPVEPDTPEPKPVDPEIPEAKPSEPAKPVEYIQGNGYKRVKDFDPATNKGETRWYLTGEGRFFVYEDEYIFEVRPRTLTYEMWCSWDTRTQVSFEMFCDWSDATLDDNYNYFRITDCENYTCGWENHYCSSEDSHQRMLEDMAEGCRYCGTSDCVSFYARGALGFTVTDSYLCPQYDIHKDPMEYCQDCGLKVGYEGCIMFVYDSNCRYCGEWVEAMTCHHCEEYDN